MRRRPFGELNTVPPALKPDRFTDDAARRAHVNGDIAKALMARADELFTEAPKIDQPDVLASKVP